MTAFPAQTGGLFPLNTAPKVGRVYLPRREDKLDEVPASLTPAAFNTAAESFIDGDTTDLVDMYSWVQRQDMTLRGLIETRLAAVLSLDWELAAASDMPHSEGVDEAAAIKAMKFCNRQIESIDTFKTFLAHNLDAIFYGVTATEMVWFPRNGRHELTRFVPVLHGALIGDNIEPWLLRISTGEHDFQGEPLTDFPRKFVVHQPSSVGNSPWGAALAIPVCVCGISKYLAWTWFLMYSERFGTPLIHANYDKNVKGVDRNQLVTWLAQLGHAGFGAFPDGVQINTTDVMKAKGGSPHETVITEVDRQAAIGILGQPLSSGTQGGDTGSFALGKVQERVRQDIRDSDITAEAETIRNQVFRPMLDLAGFKDWPAPHFVRQAEEAKDRVIELSVVKAAAELAPVPVSAVYEAAEMAPPEGADIDLDAIIEVTQHTGLPGEGGGLFNFAAVDKPIRGVPQPTRKESSPHIVLRQWVEEITQISKRHVDEVVKKLASMRRIGNASDVPNRKVVTAGIIQALGRLPSTELEAAAERFLMASQLVGADNAQARDSERKKPSITAAEPKLDSIIDSFDEALKTLSDRVLLDTNTFNALNRAAKARAGRIAGMMNVRIVEDIYDRLINTIKSGGTLSDFRQLVNELPAGEAWGTKSPSHLRLVWQQNATMAFQSGQFQQAKRAGAVSYTWRARLDSCPICSPYIGKTFAITDVSPYPGFAHFGCDCWAEKHFAEDNKKTVKINSIDNPELVASRKQKGALTGDPSSFGNLEPVDLSSVPVGLRGAFSRLLKETGA